jgi:acetoacetyl-CoA synthetase
VGRDTGTDVEVVLFVVTTPAHPLDDDLRARIRDRIRSLTSPRHVPKAIIAVSAVPYTLSGKKVEKAIRAIVNGHAVDNRDALANPEALDQYCNAARAMRSSDRR